MNVDIAKAFEPAEIEPGRAGGKTADSAFPNVFESALGGESARGTAGARKAGGPGQSGSTSSSKGTRERDGAGAPSRDAAEETTEAATESGAAGASAGAVGARDREGAGTEAEVESEGRSTALDDESRSAGLAGRRSEDGEVDPAVTDEMAEELEARLVEAGVGAAGETDGAAGATEASRAAEAAPSATGLVEGGRELAAEPLGAGEAGAVDPAEENATAGEDRGSRDSSPQDDGGRARDEFDFARAAQGSASSEVDPNLRQAIANSEAAQRAPEVVPIDGAAAVASPVAGAITEVTTTATPGAPTPPAASDAISVQTEWLVTRGGGTARLVLHPPELGEIAIRVTLRGSAVDVVMVAQEAIAHGVAEEQSERLSQAFANRDLRMENFEVRRGEAEDLPSGDGERFAESDRERQGGNGDERGNRAGAASDATSTDGELAAMPRILTATPETGVDLRI